jgi:CDP-glycerol glycerophosphotransferase
MLMKWTRTIVSLLTSFIKFPLHLIYFFSYYSIRDKKKWVFSSWEGEAYRGNCRYLFEYLQSHHEINAIWITKNKSIYNKLSDDLIQVEYAYSIKGIYTLLTAKAIFFSHGLYDVIPCFSRGALLISLGHVIYPIKKMSFTKNFSSQSFMRRLYSFLLNPYNHIKPSYEVVTSDYTKKSTMYLDSKVKSELERIVPLGLPKTDYLNDISSLSKNALWDNRLLNNIRGMDAKDKIVLFLPTWRGDENFSIFDFGYNSVEINDILSCYGAKMLINFHPFDETIRRKVVADLGDRVHSVSYQGNDITQLLCAADIFITDYSSLYSDYLLFDRPMIFPKFAHNEYIRERELQIDYDSLPGKVVSNWKELGESLDQYLSNKCDNYHDYKQSRIIWRDLIYSGTNDGGACERIYEFVKSKSI